MNSAASVPRIFAEPRRVNRTLRSERRRRQGPDAARFIIDDICDDIIERLAFVRHTPGRSLVIGACSAELAAFLRLSDGFLHADHTADPAQPIAGGPYDLAAIVGQLDAVNDLPGALIHLRYALAPGGLAIASFVGGASLPRLRAAMLAADGERPAARIHPMVDHRAAPQLLQRAGWKDPVVDTHRLTVRYSSLDRLVNDLRDQGLTGALADPAPPLGKAALERARAAFLALADDDGKVSETFEIITLTGRRSLAGR
ncbi:methyltransferase [Qipengyuania sp. ASV99]|uniref:methyltransferase n=1 Tax=Qipengyuania sp. ASV99 TaxID=3399681 RepID=UPI003A4C5F02